MQVKSSLTRQKWHSSGGNPDLKKYQFTTNRDESLTAKFTLRVTPKMLSELQAISNWREFVRDAISQKLRDANK